MELSPSDFERLFAVFILETDEHLQSLNAAVLALEVASGDSETLDQTKDAAQVELIDGIFREAHSLKGAARMINLHAIEDIAHEIETLFSDIKEDRLTLSSPVVDLMLMSFDAIASIVETVSTQGCDAVSSPQALLTQLHRLSQGLIPDLSDLVPEPPKEARVLPPKALKQAQTTLRVSSDKLDRLLAQTGELLTLKLKSSQRLREVQALIDVNTTHLRENKRRLAGLKTKRGLGLMANAQSSGGLSLQRRDRRTQLNDTKQQLMAQNEALTQLHRHLSDDLSQFSLITEQLQDDVRRTRLVPFQSVLDLFPRLVRDIGSAVDKKVRLVISGGEIAVDKYILEEMKDPMMHMIRNCIDHGIEAPPARELAGKEPEGTLDLKISHKGNTVLIELSDDGQGLNLQRIKQVALEKSLFTEAVLSTFSEQQIMKLIFSPGFSTRVSVSDVSGRGIGMDVVKAKVEKLNGNIVVENRSTGGTRFVIRLPLRLSTTQSLKISVSGRPYFLPVNRVEKIVKVSEKEVKEVEGYAAILYDQSYIPYCRLSSILTLPASEAPKEELGLEQTEQTVAILSRGKMRGAFAMDAFLGEEEILMKGMGPYMKRVRNIAGVSIMRDGRIAPVLNVSDLMSSLDRVGKFSFNVDSGDKQQKRPARVLVVDDSMMTRTLEKNILLSRGYEVDTAIDGADAILKLQIEIPDIVVSDIQMPNMDGLALTQWIKQDQRFLHIPVILVTALESRDDKKRGIEVGADAYLLKSAFDQSTLLQVLERLLSTAISIV